MKNKVQWSEEYGYVCSCSTRWDNYNDLCRFCQQYVDNTKEEEEEPIDDS